MLAAERTRAAVVARLQSELGQELADPLEASVAEALQLAAAQQPTDLLMSFDNDLPELIAGLLRASREPAQALG